MSVKIGFVGRTQPGEDGLPGRNTSLFQFSKNKDGVLKTFVVGLLSYSAADLIAMRKMGLRLDARVFGVMRLRRGVTAHLVEETVARARVSGWLLANREVKRALEPQPKKVAGR